VNFGLWRLVYSSCENWRLPSGSFHNALADGFVWPPSRIGVISFRVWFGLSPAIDEVYFFKHSVDATYQGP